MRTVNVQVAFNYEIEIDDDNDLVKEYESENAMLLDCASYRFSSVLPVISEGGVKVKDVELLEIE